MSIVYPRNQTFINTEGVLKDVPTDDTATLKAKKHGRDGQKKMWMTYTKNDFTKNDFTKSGLDKDIITPENYYLRRGWQTWTYELMGYTTPVNGLFTISDFKGKLDVLKILDYEKTPTGIAEKRLIEHVKTKFYDAVLENPLPDGEMAILGVPYEAYQLAYTPTIFLSPVPFPQPFM